MQNSAFAGQKVSRPRQATFLQLHHQTTTMRNTLIFAGSSVPELTTQICTNLGVQSAPVELGQFANVGSIFWDTSGNELTRPLKGETSVKITTSIREKDVFIVQSGSNKINDSIMELLILISACKGGSATKITGTYPSLPLTAFEPPFAAANLYSCATVFPLQ